MLIKKVKQIIPVVAKVVQSLTSNSETDVPSVKAVNEGIASIVETVTNDNGTAIKFSDGTMICTQKRQVTVDITTAWGSLYISGIIQDESFPIAFIKAPVVTRTIFAPSGTQAILIPSEGEGVPTTTNAGTYSLLRPNSRENVLMQVDTTAIGRWK